MTFYEAVKNLEKAFESLMMAFCESLHIDELIECIYARMRGEK